MTTETIRIAKNHMLVVLDALTSQLATVHVGRASASLVDHLAVEYYGSRMAIREVASITIPEPNQILITPWDKGALSAIESAIRQSDLGVNPVNDGAGLRITLPPLTEERRRELLKVVGKMAEEARIALRNYRRDAWDTIVRAQREATITEDDRDRARHELDELIDDMNKRVEEIIRTKESDMMSF